MNTEHVDKQAQNSDFTIVVNCGHCGRFISEGLTVYIPGAEGTAEEYYTICDDCRKEVILYEHTF